MWRSIEIDYLEVTDSGLNKMFSREGEGRGKGEGREREGRRRGRGVRPCNMVQGRLTCVKMPALCICL